MKKLEDIPKKEIFEVPEGYFEKLPGIIQSRVVKQHDERSSFSIYKVSLRYALPALVLLAVGIFWFDRSQTDINAENMLAAIQTEDLVAYLDETDLSTDELLEHVTLDTEDALEIEGAVYEFQLDDTNLEEIIDSID